MGGTSCKLKIILNGGAVQDLAQRLCYAVQDLPDEAISYDDGIEIVKLLNSAEDSVTRAQKKFLESQGFHGPWPRSMT